MKKLTLSLAIAALLSGCSQSPNDNRIIEDKPRIRFSPANAKILASQNDLITAAEEFSFPNDLYLTEKDGTSASLKLDGASVSAPIYVHLDLKDEVSVEETTITKESVKLYKVKLNGPLTTDHANCNTDISTALTLCKKEKELIFVGIDDSDITAEKLKDGTLKDHFTARSINGGKTLEIRPLFPLEPKKSYLVVITDALKDKNGRSFEYSYDTELMLRGHFTTGMLNTVQKIIQSQITTLTKNKNWSTALETHRVIYTAPFTTTSGEEVFTAIKNAIKTNSAYNASLTVVPPSTPQGDMKKFSGKLTLPTFSPRNASSLEDLNKNYWSAAQGISKNVTRYNPLPAIVEGVDPIDVQITVPVDGKITTNKNKLPVVILLHGITSRKEEMLGLANSYAAEGIATVAIDLPLHGERRLELSPSFDVDDDKTPDDYATASMRSVDPKSGYSPLVFMNLKSMLVARDNLRQGISDVLALRYALGKLTTDFDGYNFDKDKIGLHGFSLGGIIATSAAAYSDNDKFKFSAVALSSPGMGLANMLYSSPHFSDKIKEALVDRFGVAEGTPEFDAAVRAFVVSSQSTIDVGEPTISGHALRGKITSTNGFKTLLVQVEGDTVIGNTVLDKTSGDAATFSPVSGTTPMAGLFGLANRLTTFSDTTECETGCFLEVTEDEDKITEDNLHSSLLEFEDKDGNKLPETQARKAVIDFFKTNLK